MIVELTNHNIEMSATYDVERIDESKYGSYAEFRFYFGCGKYSLTYKEPTYSYRILER
jgi:hypothetical protein